MTSRSVAESWTGNRLTRRLGVQYPIIQGPLGGLSSERLAAAVSNFGGLGSFGAHGLKPEKIRRHTKWLIVGSERFDLDGAAINSFGSTESQHSALTRRH